MKKIEKQTGKLFGKLWHRFNDEQYKQSAELFAKRFKDNDFDLKWFKNKICLDAGCGGGRYSVAMASLGAKQVIGCDISENGIKDAQRRCKDIPSIRFDVATILDLPYEDNFFDFVCCSGVIHHTVNPLCGIAEVSRVLKTGGKAYFLIYGKGTIRWELMINLRTYLHYIGYDIINAVACDFFPANKQRHFLDDFFVPVLNFFSRVDITRMLSACDFNKIDFWEKGRYFHEVYANSQVEEFYLLIDFFNFLRESKHINSVYNGEEIVDIMINLVSETISTSMVLGDNIFGVDGAENNRVLAIKY
jgi:SAM-dependent methyltransferase